MIHALLIAVGAGHVWIVDDDGGVGVDFTDIQPAVSAAAPGDSVLVREGSYRPFSVDFALTVYGEDRQTVRVENARVHDTAPGQRVSLVGMWGSVEIEQCSELVTVSDWLGEVTAWSSVDVRVHDLGHDGNGRSWVSARGSRLEVVRGRIEAFDGNPGDTGVRAEGSVVHLAQLERVQAGNGLDYYYGEYYDGGHAVFAIDSEVLLTGTGQTIIRGGNGTEDCCNPVYDGASGHGVAAVGHSTLRRSGVSVYAGACYGQPAGCGTAVLTRFDEVPSVPDPVLEAFDRLDGGEGLRVFAEVGAQVQLEWGTTPVVAAAAGPVDRLLVPALSDDLGIVPSFGVIEVQADPMFANEPILFAQAVVLGTDGRKRRTNSAVLVRLPQPCSDVPLSVDCDANGLDDACELLRSLATDCDGNGTIDACQPTLPDANVDGVPDLCQSFTTIWVDDDAPFDPGPGDSLISDPLEDGSQLHPFDSIAEAVNQFVNGDRIAIEPGLYQGKGNYLIKPSAQSLLIQGAGPTETIIDVEGQSVFIEIKSSNYAQLTRLESLTIKQATAAVWESATSRLHIRNCHFEGNGLPVRSTRDILIEDCAFLSNGGLHLRGDRATILRSSFDDNSTPYVGGAIDMNVDAGLIESCTFRANSAAYGGAVWIWAEDARHSRIESCLFLDNRAMHGGAVFALMNGRPATDLIARSTFVSNQAALGGALLIAPLSEPSTVFIEDSLFWQNDGGLGQDVIVNEGPYSPISLSEANIVFGTTNLPGGTDAIPVPMGVSVFAQGELFDFDPLLSPDGHLEFGSPLIDHGSQSPDLSPGAVDFEGNPRLQGAAIDIGSDEVVAP